jgi:hypothetical protein
LQCQRFITEGAKEKSWSDESGHELVNYDNEVRISNASSTDIQTFSARENGYPAMSTYFFESFDVMLLIVVGLLCCSDVQTV